MGMIITSLGLSGSGKTVFLSTLLDSLHSAVNSIDNFYLADRSIEGGELLTDTLQHKNISIASNLHKIGEDGFRGYPMGTTSTVFREFALLNGKENILDIGWLDYKGGLLSTDEDDDLGDKDDLYSFLDKSTATIVYLDAYRITKAKSIKQARRQVGADVIGNILSHFESSKEDKVVNILFVLTQVDAIEDSKWVGDGSYKPLTDYTLDVLGGITNMINRNLIWNCGIVAVSAVGVGNNKRQIIQEATFNKPIEVIDEIIDEPKPLNIVESFFWLVACEVASQRQKTHSSINRIKSDMEKEKARISKGKAKVARKVIEKENERLNNMNFFNRFIDKTLYDSRNRNNVEHEKNIAKNNWESSQQHTIQKIEDRMFNENFLLAKYENTLQPLFNASRNIVRKI